MHARVIHVTDIGWKARPLLEGASASPTVVAALSRSLYLDVDGEIVWLGPAGSTLHGRAIVAIDPPTIEAGERVQATFDLRAAREWRPPTLSPAATIEGLADACHNFTAALDRLGPPDGFGALLVGRRPAFPLHHAEARARRFLEACARGDAPAAMVVGECLLGLGPGLTPAGDDLVGGAFFARRLLVEIGAAPAAPWHEAAAAIRARAPERTHRISAALLGDLLDGDGYAPLHDLAITLARGEVSAGLDVAARLVRIGHSSGWDLLTGFLGALDLPRAGR